MFLDFILMMSSVKSVVRMMSWIVTDLHYHIGYFRVSRALVSEMGESQKMGA